jgi:hypothetical protein
MEEFWAKARIYAGLSDAEFLRRTPYEVNLLIKMAYDKLIRSQQQVALFRYSYTNGHRKEGTDPIPLYNFLPLEENLPKDSEGNPVEILPDGKPVMQAQEFLAHAIHLTNLMGGYVDPRFGEQDIEASKEYFRNKQ